MNAETIVFASGSFSSYVDARTAGGTEESTLLSSTETLSGAKTVRIADLGPHLS
jgi:hypothetical protein